MKGTVTIASFTGGGMIRDDNPIRGKWQYNNGVLVRGVLRRETFNLSSKIKAIRHCDHEWKKIAADDIANGSFMKAALMAGGNTIVGLATVSIKKKNIMKSELFDVLLKDGTQFICITDKVILREMMNFEGVVILNPGEEFA
jgi:hypothetical protein